MRILLQGPTQTFTITGLTRFGTANNLAGATLAAFDVPTAQTILGEVGKFDTINVVAQPGANKAAVQRDIARVLPHGVEVVTGQTVINEQTAPSARPWASSTRRCWSSASSRSSWAASPS